MIQYPVRTRDNAKKKFYTFAVAGSYHVIRIVERKRHWLFHHDMRPVLCRHYLVGGMIAAFGQNNGQFRTVLFRYFRHVCISGHAGFFGQFLCAFCDYIAYSHQARTLNLRFTQ